MEIYSQVYFAGLVFFPGAGLFNKKKLKVLLLTCLPSPVLKLK